jgi:hypothetical protein
MACDAWPWQRWARHLYCHAVDVAERYEEASGDVGSRTGTRTAARSRMERATRRPSDGSAPVPCGSLLPRTFFLEFLWVAVPFRETTIFSGRLVILCRGLQGSIDDDLTLLCRCGSSRAIPPSDPLLGSVAHAMMLAFIFVLLQLNDSFKTLLVSGYLHLIEQE